MNEPQAEAIKPAGENAPGALPEPSTDTLAAGHEAISQHESENGKSRRGRPIIHGKYAGRKRQKPAGPVPVGQMANSPMPILLEETLPLAPELGIEAVEPVFNEEINRRYAGLIVALVVSVSNAVKKRRIIKATGHQELAEWVISKKKIGDAPREAMETGLVECARKYQMDLSRSPEGMLIGGFLLWQAEDAANTQALIAEFQKLPGREPRS